MAAVRTDVDEGRRRFLQVSAAAGGVMLVGFRLDGRALAAEGDARDSAAFEPNAWIRIGGGRDIKLLCDRSEMGQGVMTAMPMLIAEELEVDLEQVRVEMAPAGRAYDNPLLGLQVTGGSTAVRAAWEPLRRAGATAREMLITAAAERWQVPRERLRAERAEVVDPEAGQRLGYVDLAEAAAQVPLPESVTLKKPGEFRLLGTRQERVDIPSKVDGSAVFGIDVEVPGLLVASVERPPRFGASVKRYDASAARAVEGVRDVVEIGSGVAVVADTFWQAQKGREALEVEWEPGPNAGRSIDDIRARYRELADRKGAEAHQEGDPLSIIDGSEEVVEAIYEVPYLAHATMEPMNATADVRADSCTVWAPTQNQGSTKEVAVALTGLDYSQVRVHTTQLGGGFGRRAEVDFVTEAVECSKAVGRPVKVQWTREDDVRHDFYRPAMLHRLRAGLDADGRTRAWHHRVVGPAIMPHAYRMMGAGIMPRWMPRWMKNMMARFAGFYADQGADPSAVEGAAELPYAYPHVRVDYVQHDESFVPVGFWRSVGHSHTAFVVESFVDELAYRAGEDPYEYRRKLLAEAPRRRGVLELAAEKAGWGSPMPEGRSRGIAVHKSFGSFVGMVAEVSVSDDGEVRVHRVVAAVDCGQTVNPDTIEAQIEGAMVFGLSAALKPGVIDIRDGGVVQGNFDDYQVLRMDEMPEVETHIVDSDEAPGGVGEIGTPPIAPAVANAVFAATGKRVRSLPIRPEMLTG